MLISFKFNYLSYKIESDYLDLFTKTYYKSITMIFFYFYVCSNLVIYRIVTTIELFNIFDIL